MKRLALTVFLLVTIYCLLVTAIYADIPRTINYQGKLTDKQGYALNGEYNVTFKLYDVETGGTPLWTEFHSNIQVQKGLFSVLLGTMTPLNLSFDKQYYLGIQVGADPEMAPRQILASAPYAFTAESAKTVTSPPFSGFGAWYTKDTNNTDFARNTVYKAQSHGFLIVFRTGYENQAPMNIYSDSKNPPSTERGRCFTFSSSTGSSISQSTIPIRKDDYWLVTGGASDTLIQWIPLNADLSCVKQ